MSIGPTWPSRQLHATGCVSGQGLLREICWLTGNDIHWELGFPQDVLSVGVPVFSLNPEMKLPFSTTAIFIIITISILFFLLTINVKIIFVSLASHWIRFCTACLHHDLSNSWLVATGLPGVFPFVMIFSCQFPTPFPFLLVCNSFFRSLSSSCVCQSDSVRLN